MRSRSPAGAATKPPSIALLSVLTAIGPASLHIITPALPLLAIAFDSPASSVQLVLTLYLAGIAVAQLAYGPLSDRYGRRPILLLGLVLYLAGTALCFEAWSLPVLIAGRVLQAAGGCAGMVLGRAIVRDVYDRERATRALAMITMAMVLAPSFSPALGGYLAELFGWRWAFAALGIVGTLCLVLSAAFLAETNPTRAAFDARGMVRAMARLLRSPLFLSFAFGTAFTSASWFTFTAGAAFLLAEILRAPPSTYGLMILWPMFAYMLGNAIAVRYALRLGSNRMLLIGLGSSLASGILMIAWPLAIGFSSWSIFISIALSCIGNGLSQPANMAGALSVHPEIAGTASGLLGFMQMAVSALGTFVVVQLPHDTPLPMLLVVGLCLLLAFLFGFVPLSQSRRQRNAMATA